MNPRRFDTLVVCGFIGVPAADRPRPSFESCVIRDPESGEVFLPPLQVDGGGLADADEVVTTEVWMAMVASGDATSIKGMPARADACVYIPEGNLPFELVSYAECVRRLHQFADGRARDGLRRSRAGDDEGAIACWADAAATASRPIDYARLLNALPRADPRFARIERKLAQTADGGNTQELLHRAQEEIGTRGSIFGSSADSTAEPFPISP